MLKNYKGQVSFETLIGFTVFLIFFIGVMAFVTSETNALYIQQDNIKKMDSCVLFSQALFEAKNSKIKWSGSADYNYYLKNNTIYIDYTSSASFEGVYCKTISTNLTKNITKGDVNVYFDSTSFVITQ